MPDYDINLDDEWSDSELLGCLGEEYNDEDDGEEEESSPYNEPGGNFPRFEIEWSEISRLDDFDWLVD